MLPWQQWTFVSIISRAEKMNQRQQSSTRIQNNYRVGGITSLFSSPLFSVFWQKFMTQLLYQDPLPPRKLGTSISGQICMGLQGSGSHRLPMEVWGAVALPLKPLTLAFVSRDAPRGALCNICVLIAQYLAWLSVNHKVLSFSKDLRLLMIIPWGKPEHIG